VGLYGSAAGLSGCRALLEAAHPRGALGLYRRRQREHREQILGVVTERVALLWVRYASYAWHPLDRSLLVQRVPSAEPTTLRAEPSVPEALLGLVHAVTQCIRSLFEPSHAT
jgi:hypothetical protein